MGDPPDSLKKSIDLARKLRISPKDVQKFEDCERVTDMLQEEHIDAIKDQGLQRTVRLMKREHGGIRAQHSEPFVKKAESLFRLLPRYDAVIDYHMLEQELEGVDDAEIDRLTDPGLKKLLLSVKHVHDKNHGKRKAKIFKEIVDP